MGAWPQYYSSTETEQHLRTEAASRHAAVDAVANHVVRRDPAATAKIRTIVMGWMGGWCPTKR